MFKTTIPIYAICIILSLILKKEESLGLIIYIILGTIYGAKLFTIITNLDKGVIKFQAAGLSSYGAVIGIIIMLLLFGIQFKKKISDLLYIVVTVIPLMYAIGKIGCFLVGCCYGVEYSGPFNVVYNYSLDAPKGIHLFPIQLVETIVFTIIYLIINRIDKKNKRIYLTFIICAMSKFMLDFLRFRETSQILSINQIVSIIFFIIGIICYNKDKNRGRIYE